MTYIMCSFVALAAGTVMDMLLSDPSWRFHPICLIGRLISYIEKVLRKIIETDKKEDSDSVERKEYIAGIFLMILVSVISFIAPAEVLFICWKINKIIYICAAIPMVYFALSAKCLKKESMKVYGALQTGDIVKARQAVSMLVGRDTQRLDAAGVTRAAVETVAENTSDGCTAPLFYMALFGPAAGYFYKAVNTLDSMVGYKNEKYMYFGRVSAKADDVLNFIPSRLSACFMIIASFILRFNYKNAAYIFKRDRKKSTSPNSGQTESVCAGALGVRLLGDTYYFGKLYKKPHIGDALRNIEAEDIKRANSLMYGTHIITLMVICVVYFIFFMI